ncbi:MAG: M4 family metallopeptidase [Actinomycetia bacterium]|nr:M4 family metallopeptidase [Actinomycetes bacterium]MCL2730137.1 M4 family metallopeptidase [Actinomycetes bacterium]
MAVGQGVAALLAAAGLVVTAVPAAHADTAAQPAATPGTSASATPSTLTPPLVTGLDETVPATGSAADAAVGHLAAKKSRYHIDNPTRDLSAVSTEREGKDETVRLQQKYRGVPVLGGQYVVRMRDAAGKRTVTGTSGSFFTQLDLPTTTPDVSTGVAVSRAVGAVSAQLGQGPLARPTGAQAQQHLAGTDDGLTVLPQGKGVLTRHVTVSGTNPRTGEPVVQEVYVEAHSGYPVLQYSGLQTFAPTGTATGGTAVGSDGSGAADAAPAATQLVVKGTGVRYNGQTAELNLYQGSDGAYQMIDYSKRDAATPYNGEMIATYDARGREVATASGSWPSGIKTFSSPTTDLGEDYTDSGAVDAHWAAGQVYDYYHSKFGRNGLDGKNGFIYSLVGVVNHGQPYNNAFWDGSKMVYGQGGGDYRTFSADTDVVGHEMTHGVIEHTANLVYAGQSGAMNEALADYFGNAIDVEANHIPMTDPDASLLGEDLCVHAAPRDCALRDLDDGATTSKNFVGVTFRGDDGGVHENSTIFSGALWNMREDIGGDLADQIVYRALTAYMTPLDGFTQGRAAVIAAAQELGVTKAQMQAVKRAFAAHGIVPGWETALGIDSDTLISKVNVAGTGVGAGGGKYAVSLSNDDGSEPYSVWAGNTSGKGGRTLISGNNGDYNVYADTDGKTVAWADFAPSSILIKVRPLAGGPEKTVYSSITGISSVAVDGDYVVFTESDPFGGVHVGYRNIKTGDGTWVDGGQYQLSTALPSVHAGVIAYAKLWPESDGYKIGVETTDLNTGKVTLMPVDKNTTQAVGQTAVTGDSVYWMADTDLTDGGKVSVERADLDGTHHVTLAPESGDSALYGYTLTASDDAVTVMTVPPATSWANDTLPKLYQISADGKSGVQRVSCDRGDQVYASADTGTRVLWLDGTTGWTDLVKRDRPAGKC